MNAVNMKKSSSNIFMKKFSLIELLVSISLIAILAGLLLPVLNSARAKGNQILCLSNLKQIGTGLISYCGDHSSWLPKTGFNADFVPGIMPYLQINKSATSAIGQDLLAFKKNKGVFFCPSQKKATDSPAWNGSEEGNLWLPSYQNTRHYPHCPNRLENRSGCWALNDQTNSSPRYRKIETILSGTVIMGESAYCKNNGGFNQNGQLLCMNGDSNFTYGDFSWGWNHNGLINLLRLDGGTISKKFTGFPLFDDNLIPKYK